MSLNPPPSQDVQDIQFKLHNRISIFPEGNDVKSLVSLLAVSSAKGLLFAGNASTKELKVFKLSNIVNTKTTGQNVTVRVINLPGEPFILACSSDGSMLAINYILNNTSFLQIYQVDSFVTATINCLYDLPVAPENNTFALQLLWNPVISNNIALILSDGSVAMFTLNNGGQYEKMTLGKDYKIKSGCWSPKGKQIVFGFAEGKLQQFKPNLQPARTIQCPSGIYEGSFDCVAVHWLSTFQFAAIFLQRGADMCPSLFIINAPKTGPPSYINYYDICYSAPGPRIHQLSFNHIAQWNLLLVTSANGVEIGVLGTKESGEAPKWIQYTLLDEARIEMPLTESKDETYPQGFVFDFASSHQVVIGEKKLPVMPMIHVLSTHGHLISYNFLNLSPDAVDICSPALPLNDVSGQFVQLSETSLQRSATVKPANNAKELGAANKKDVVAGFKDTAFTSGFNMVTSTPTNKDKSTTSFTSQQESSKSVTGLNFAPSTTPVPATASTNTNSNGIVFGATGTQNAPAFAQPLGGITKGTSFGGFSGSGFLAKSEEKHNPPAEQRPVVVNKNTELNKPLYNVPPTFTPPKEIQQIDNIQMNQIKPDASSNRTNLSTGEMDELVKQMIVIEIQAFETEMRKIRQQPHQLLENIGSPNDLKSYTQQLNDLQEIVQQASDHEFEQDVQSLRHCMNESYAMLAECRAKLDLYNNPNLTHLSVASSTDPTSRRQLAKLQAYVNSNQNQLSQLNQLIDAQWSQYQDVVRRNSKNQMHIPCLDGIYQRMSKLKDSLSRQRTKMNYIKTKLIQKGLNYKPPNNGDVTSAAIGALTKSQSTVESLADSILSMSLSQVVSRTHAKLSEEKLNAIRNFTKQRRQIAIIKPKRPDRVGLKSEVILETKLENERKQKEMVKQQLHQQKQQQQYQQQQQFAAFNTPINLQLQNYQNQSPQQILKPQTVQQPTLAKPTASKPILVSSQPHTFITPTSSTSATFSFGGNSSFVKTSMLIPTANESNENKIASAPLSFAAKVIGGKDAAKPFANLENKMQTQNNLVQSSLQDNKQTSGFSAFATTKPTTQTVTQNKYKPLKAEETNITAKPTCATSTTSISSTSLFAPNAGTSAVSPFTGTSSFSFNTNASACASGASTSVTNTNNNSGIIVTSSSQFTAAVTVKPTDITAPIINATPIDTAATEPIPSSSVASNITATGPKSSVVPNITMTSFELSGNKAGTAPLTTTNTTSFIKDPGSILDSLTICKPIVKESADSNKSSNVFSAFAVSTSLAPSAPLSDTSTTSVATTANSGFSFLSTASATTATSSAAISAGEVPPTCTVTVALPSNLPSSIKTESAKSPFSLTTVAADTTSTADSLFGSLSVSSSSPSCKTATADTNRTTVASGNIFGGGPSGIVLTTTLSTTSTTTSIFGGGTAVASNTSSLFSSTAPAATSPSSGSIFAAAAATPQSPGNIFGGIPKPEQPIFSVTNNNSQPSGTGLFAAAAANSKPITATGGSIFGGGSSGFGGSAGGSIFGGGNTSSSFAPASSANSTVSMFGSTAPKNTTEGGIFGSATQQSVASGGSLFSKTSFGATPAAQIGGNIFGGGSAQSPTSGGFGTGGGSLFGASASTNSPVSGGSLFGATAATTAPSFGASPTSSGFGSFSQSSAAPPFASPTTAGFGAPASTGFGSPQQQSAFAKPVFGGAPTFGSSQPTFGGQATFGGVPTFASPKGFGSFASTSPTAQTFGTTNQGSTAPKGNIFETLGSQDSGLSFGNLAHSTQNPQQKATFGGSSFMNYRS